ncbi:hypothetical protein H310_00068 [Aphanomyces invadans]|uniref:Uncharacterized protein n=1 Tax=Aphanomyces invadans TaxID=157072 RepID=A0A024UU78_9STRA|nr:hypothetical protein H310_00068 [Aphanomyces invadans]ETW09500.1 hypothetical protein H310_00068 [Aphanomyces invadans]|eukprot:XP_008860911.1 hypothetical protein H310_00068 [Aphanomyces invadans]
MSESSDTANATKSVKAKNPLIPTDAHVADYKQPRPSPVGPHHTGEPPSDVSPAVVLRDEASTSPLNLRFSFNFDERNELSITHNIDLHVPPLWASDAHTSLDSVGAGRPPTPDGTLECAGAARRKQLKEGRTEGFGKPDVGPHISKTARGPPSTENPLTTQDGAAAITTDATQTTSALEPPPDIPHSPLLEAPHDHSRCLSPYDVDHGNGKQDEGIRTGKDEDVADKVTGEVDAPKEASVVKAQQPHFIDAHGTEAPKTAQDLATIKIELDQLTLGSATRAAESAAPLQKVEKPRLEYTMENVYPSKWEDIRPGVATSTLASKVAVKSELPAATSKRTKASIARRPTLSHTAPSAVHTPTAQQALEHQLKAALKAMQSEMAALKIQLQCTVVERDGLQTRWARALADPAALTSQIQAQHVQVATSVAERDEFAQQCASLQQSVVAAQAETDSHRKKLMAVQIELHHAKAKCSVAEGKAEALTKGKAEAMAKLEVTKGTVMRLQSSVDHAKEKIHKLEVEIASLRHKRAADAQALTRTVDQMRQHATIAMEKATAQWTAELAAKDASVQSHVDKTKRLADDANAMLHRRNQALEAKLTEAKNRIAVLETQVRPVQLLTKRVKALEAVHHENKRLQQELTTAHRDAAAAKHTRSKTKPAQDAFDILLASPTILSNQSQHSPSKSADNEALKSEVGRLLEKLRQQEQQLVQLRVLHSQELQAQATMFQAHVARATSVLK